MFKLQASVISVLCLHLVLGLSKGEGRVGQVLSILDVNEHVCMILSCCFLLDCTIFQEVSMRLELRDGVWHSCSNLNNYVVCIYVEPSIRSLTIIQDQYCLLIQGGVKS